MVFTSGLRSNARGAVDHAGRALSGIGNIAGRMRDIGGATTSWDRGLGGVWWLGLIAVRRLGAVGGVRLVVGHWDCDSDSSLVATLSDSVGLGIVAAGRRWGSDGDGLGDSDWGRAIRWDRSNRSNNRRLGSRRWVDHDGGDICGWVVGWSEVGAVDH